MRDKSIVIIDCFFNASDGLTLSQVMRAAKFPKTTAYQCLENLVKNKLLYKHSNQYFLGPVLLRWIHTRQHKQGFVKLLHPYLVDISEKTGETAHLVQKQDNKAVYIDKVEGNSSIRLQSRIGTELRLYSTGAGRALLAALSDEELDEYFSTQKIEQQTPYTLTDVAKIKKEIISFRKQGYATEIEQNEKNIQCVGTWLQWGALRLAISITATLLTKPGAFKRMGALVVQTKKKIISELKI